MGFLSGSTFKTKEQDRETLLKERKESIIPFSKTPFHNEPAVSPVPGERGFGSEGEELRVNVAEEVGWIDLLLELAMTTAFANLADNTAIATGKDVASYVAFFGLVWWIWASQVAYNMRFRQGDWFHRGAAFCMLIVFSAMAAFTNNFDITSGLGGDDSEQAEITRITEILGGSGSNVAAAYKREARLPVLNSRGISLVLGFSRLLLISQYCVVLYYARRFRRHALIVHIGSMMISMTMFFAAYGILQGENVTRGDEVAKIVLWYIPVGLEVGAHFLANTLPGHVSYPGEAVFARASTLFIVVLGIGLDKITNQFRFVVGTLGFRAISVGSMLSIAVILIGYFSLYFGAGEQIKKGNHRALIYFFAHLPFMAGLIVLLRGIASLISFVNFSNAVEAITTAFTNILDKADSNGGLTVNQFPNEWRLFNNAGLSLEVLLAEIDAAATNASSPRELINRILKLELDIFETVLGQYGAAPEPDSLANFRLAEILNGNETVQDPNQILTFMNDALAEKMTPALWFFGLAGSTLFLLGVLMFLRNTPRDRYEWAALLVRVIAGTVLMLFSVFNIDSGLPISTLIIDPDTAEILQETDSPSVIWKFAGSGWMLPTLAIILIIVNILSLLINIVGYRCSNSKTYHVPQGNQAMPNFLTMTPNFPVAYPTAPSISRSSSSIPGAFLTGMGNQQSKEHVYDPYAPVYDKGATAR